MDMLAVSMMNNLNKCIIFFFFFFLVFFFCVCVAFLPFLSTSTLNLHR